MVEKPCSLAAASRVSRRIGEAIPARLALPLTLLIFVSSAGILRPTEAEAEVIPPLRVAAVATAESLAAPVAASGEGRAGSGDVRPVASRGKRVSGPRGGRARTELVEQRFRNLSLLRAACLALGFAVFAWGVWLAQRKASSRLRLLQRALLVSLALASVASYYNFFRFQYPSDFKVSDVFHYYMGSKYYAEISYFDLYECSLAALIEEGRASPDRLPEVRNQHSMEIQLPETTRRRIRECPSQFEPDRWAEFKRDTSFFRRRMDRESWTHVMTDHGFNPSPVWAFVGGLFASRVSVESEGFTRLIQLDRVLGLVAAGFVAWAFGVQSACLALVVWGTSPLWSYNWIGDAFLRNLWLSAALIGLSLLRRQLPLASGLALSLATLLRLFPGVLIAGYALHLLRGLRARGIPPHARRFILGAGLGTLVLLVGGSTAGRGVSAYLEFWDKVSNFAVAPAQNKLGLSSLANELVYEATSFDVVRPDGEVVEVQQGARATVIAIRAVQVTLIGVGLVAFWIALPGLRDWEAAAAAFALAPLLQSPPNYYYPLFLCAALLASRRPWVGIALGVTCLGWTATSLVFFLDSVRYYGYSVIAVASCLVVLIGLARSTPPLRDDDDDDAGSTSSTPDQSSDPPRHDPGLESR